MAVSHVPSPRERDVALVGALRYTKSPSRDWGFLFWPGCAYQLNNVEATSFCFNRAKLFGRNLNLSPTDRPGVAIGDSRQAAETYGRHEETRTPDLYRVKVAL
jgi:hypothetical protein